jgi:hypothetical protein
MTAVAAGCFWIQAETGAVAGVVCKVAAIEPKSAGIEAITPPVS